MRKGKKSTGITSNYYMDNKELYDYIHSLPNKRILSDGDMPEGWKKLWNTFENSLYALDGTVESVIFKQGTLQVKCTSEKYPVAVQWLAKGLAQASSQTCIFTGEFSHRRKDVIGSPPMKWELYIQYLNTREEYNVERNDSSV